MIAPTIEKSFVDRTRRWLDALRAKTVERGATLEEADTARQLAAELEAEIRGKASPPHTPITSSAPAPPSPTIVWTEEQRRALDAIARWARGETERMISLTGFAGTGKTVCLREVVRLLAHASVRFTATTGRAAVRLRETLGGNVPTSTLHSVLYYRPEERQTARGVQLDFDRVKQPIAAFVIVDEASLITPAIYEDLSLWADLGVRVLLVGDPFQLPPVVAKGEGGARPALPPETEFTVFAHVGGPQLTRVFRFDGPILEAATYVRERRRILPTSRGAYRFARVQDPAAQAISDWLFEPEGHVLLTWRNERRMAANEAIRARLGRRGVLPEPGEPLLLKQNTAGLTNGEIVTARGWRPGPTVGGPGGLCGPRPKLVARSADALASEPPKLGTETVWIDTDAGELLTFAEGHAQPFDGGRPYIEDWGAWLRFTRRQGSLDDREWILDERGVPYPIPVPMSYGYVLTAHAAQGSEWPRVTLFLGPGDVSHRNFSKPSVLPDGTKVPFGARFLYVVLTRAREGATLYIA